jgi:hypothetical protein
MTTEQKATLPARGVLNGKWLDNKEQIAFAAVVAFNGCDFVQPVTARWWTSRRADGAGRVWCTLWTSDARRARNGHGSATGCGYHKTSAALQAAIDSAGISLAAPIDGRGDSAIEDAMLAIADALGYETATIVRG